VLRLLGGVIRHSIRLVDTAYRYGGDEFLVLLPETDFAGAFVVAEKVRSGAEEMGLAAGGGELLTSVSVGLVSCPEDGTTAEELMIAADRAMYQAKSLGKNQVSGNPRPRRLAYSPAADLEQAGEEPTSPPPMEAPSAIDVPKVIEVPPTPVAAQAAVFSVSPEPEIDPNPPAVPVMASGNSREGFGDEEADPTVVRRQIAAARLNMDPDHQIRRAMDAFLSPTRTNGDGGN
jgi:hypothetical protein